MVLAEIMQIGDADMARIFNIQPKHHFSVRRSDIREIKGIHPAGYRFAADAGRPGTGYTSNSTRYEQGSSPGRPIFSNHNYKEPSAKTCGEE